jgi:NADH dehydrogenase/NADH:ubiquinone oxidoreductase subunit G
MVKIIVDNRELDAEAGANLLEVCLDNDIYIPNLCYVEGMEKSPASCRLCFVDVEGEKEPLAACAIEVREGLRVSTETPGVRGLQKSAFELIMSTHRIDCGNCPSSKDCVLIKISKFLKVKLKPVSVEEIQREHEEEEHPCLVYDHTKCIMCRRCVYRCSRLYEHPYLSVAGRGLEAGISFFGETDSENIPCKDCLACVEECPVSALLECGHQK